MKMPRFRRLAAASATAAAVASGVALAAPGMAAATPSNCSTAHIGGSSGSVTCTTGDGTYRVKLLCRHLTPVYTYYVYGPYMPRGQASVAHCNSGDLVADIGYQFA